jgi:hypothetical protein
MNTVQVKEMNPSGSLSIWTEHSERFKLPLQEQTFATRWFASNLQTSSVRAAKVAIACPYPIIMDAKAFPSDILLI